MQEKKSNNNFEKLKNIASDHLFMHGVQINDLKNEGPKIFVNGEGSWVTDIEGNKYLDMMDDFDQLKEQKFQKNLWLLILDQNKK